MENGWIILLIVIALTIGISLGFSSKVRGYIILGLLIFAFCFLFCLGMFIGIMCMSSWLLVLVTAGVVILAMLFRKFFLHLPDILYLGGIIMGVGGVIGAFWGLIHLVGAI